ncbi:MAG: hypothetical protein JNN15_02080, partial [Blastocatellia bacterium]|nr:hypothetical protein [Blastocatellia bacterium]
MDKKSFPRSLLLSLVLAFAALLLPLNWVFADEVIDLRQQLISRISLLEGDASVRHRGSQNWEEAGINLPLAAGDSIYTGRNSRLELQVYLLFIRLSEDTSLEAVELSPNRYRFNLSLGTATFSAEDEIKEFEISTPRAAVLIKKAGVYRINVLPNGDTEVVTLTGETELISDNGSRIKLKEGKKATFGSDPSDVEISATYISDYWDGWNQERDNLLKISSDTDRYISRNGYLYGNSDLDAYGNWVNVPGHGWSWQPRNVGVGWSPYRIGR